MALSTESFGVLQRAIDQKIGTCPLCSQRHWTTNGELAVIQTVPRLSRRKSPGLAGLLEPVPVYRPEEFPVLPLMCKVCGNTVLLNVYALGVSGLWPGLAPAATKS